MRDDELAEALSAAGVGIWSWDLRTNVKTRSPDLFRLFGLPEEGPAPTFDEYIALVHPDDRAHVDASVRAALDDARRTGRPVDCEREYRVVVAGGDVRWVHSRARVLVDADGPSLVMGVDLDVTVRKVATERADEAQEVARLFAELASDYVYRVDLSEPVLVPTVLAGSFERTTGMTIDELRARGGWLAVVHPDDRASLEANFPAVLEGRPAASEYRLVGASGTVRWVRDLVRPVVGPDGRVTHFWGGVQDVTQRKQLEEELLHARKQEALARLAGAVAHDFNNLLGVVSMSLDVLARRGLGPRQEEPSTRRARPSSARPISRARCSSSAAATPARRASSTSTRSCARRSP